MDYKRGTRIVMDEDKIKREGKYELDKLYQNIDELAEHAGLIKKNKYTYICQGNERDLAALGIFNFMNLVKKEWFTRNVKEWIWLNKNEGDTDLIESCKKHYNCIWA